MLINSINLEGDNLPASNTKEKLASLQRIIEEEKQVFASVAVIEDWLRGVPSALDSPVYYCEQEKTLIDFGVSHATASQITHEQDRYFELVAGILEQLFRLYCD